MVMVLIEPVQGAFTAQLTSSGTMGAIDIGCLNDEDEPS
jgi:hypothetical protein